MGTGVMQDQRNSRRRAGRKGALLALLATIALPLTASATIFSFGTINPTDQIASLNLAPTSLKTTYDPDTNLLHIDAYLTTISFVGGAVMNIPVDTVLLQSDIWLTSFSVVNSLPNNPRSFASGFSNGLLMDFSIFDTGFGIALIEADYVGSLSITGGETGPIATPLLVQAQLNADLKVLPSGDPDFRAAFGEWGRMSANLSGIQSDGANVGNNLCNLVRGGPTSGSPTHASQTCPVGFWNGSPDAEAIQELDDFSINANLTIVPIPEPGSAVLLALGLLGVAALRRK
jgi:hypothetical protein